MAEENASPAPVNSEMVPKKCCKEKTATDSEPTKSPEPIGSIMKLGYQHPSVHTEAFKKDIPRRRALYRAKVVAEMIEEIKRERDVKDPVEDYCTTYDDMYQIPGFKLPDKIEYHEEMHLKHPLYASKTVTYWTDKIDKHLKDCARLPGMTKIRNLTDPFRKNGEFTTPMHMRLDNAEC